MPSKYIFEQTATNFIKNDTKRTVIQNYIQQAQNLNNQYLLLESRQRDLLYAQQLQTEHQQNMQMALNENESIPYLNTTYFNFQNSKNINNLQGIQQWLTDLHHWSLQGYKVVMGLRKEVTGQEFVYHIQDSAHSYHYTLNENQYLRLLASNSLSMSYSSIDQLASIVQGKMPMADLFKLQVDATQKKLDKINNWSQQKGHGEILKSSLKSDILYQYLSEKDGGVIKDSSGRVLHSRIYELYSQLSASYKWARDSDGSIKASSPSEKNAPFFSASRKKAVDSFIAKYKKANLHIDNTAFYKTGDAIQDANTLIENKVGKAVVSVSTIRRAIQDIAKLGSLKTAAQFKKELIQMFTYSGTEAFAKRLQEGARKAAEKAIKELFKS